MSSTPTGWQIASPFVEAAVKTGLSEIPVVGGFLSTLAGLLWPSSSSSPPAPTIDAQTVWDDIRGQVNAAINAGVGKAISDANYAQLQAKLVGLQGVIQDYNSTALGQDKLPTDILAAYVSAKQEFIANIPSFQSPTVQQVQLLPLFAPVAQLHLTLLRDGILFGPQRMGWHAADWNECVAEFRQALTSYTQYVAQVYQTYSENTNPQGGDVDDWVSTTNLLSQAVQAYVNDWPYLDATLFQGALSPLPAPAVQIYQKVMINNEPPMGSGWAPLPQVLSDERPPISSLEFCLDYTPPQPPSYSTPQSFSPPVIDGIKVFNGTTLTATCGTFTATSSVGPPPLQPVALGPNEGIIQFSVGMEELLPFNPNQNPFGLPHFGPTSPMWPPIPYASSWGFTIQTFTNTIPTTASATPRNFNIGNGSNGGMLFSYPSDSPPQQLTFVLSSLIPSVPSSYQDPSIRGQTLAATANFIAGFRDYDSYRSGPQPHVAQALIAGTYSGQYTASGTAVSMTLDFALVNDALAIDDKQLSGTLTITPATVGIAGGSFKDATYDGTTFRATINGTQWVLTRTEADQLVGGPTGTGNQVAFRLTVPSLVGLYGTYQGTVTLADNTVEDFYVVFTPEQSQSNLSFFGSASINGQIGDNQMGPKIAGLLTSVVQFTPQSVLFSFTDDNDNSWQFTGGFNQTDDKQSLQFGILSGSYSTTASSNEQVQTPPAKGSWSLRKFV